MNALVKCIRDLAEAEAKLHKASQARRLHPVGSSRAKVTSLNARHAQAAEARERVWHELTQRLQMHVDHIAAQQAVSVLSAAMMAEIEARERDWEALTQRARALS